jgi:hypothetical protein
VWRERTCSTSGVRSPSVCANLSPGLGLPAPTWRPWPPNAAAPPLGRCARPRAFQRLRRNRPSGARIPRRLKPAKGLGAHVVQRRGRLHARPTRALRFRSQASHGTETRKSLTADPGARRRSEDRRSGVVLGAESASGAATDASAGAKHTHWRLALVSRLEDINSLPLTKF